MRCNKLLCAVSAVLCSGVLCCITNYSVLSVSAVLCSVRYIKLLCSVSAVLCSGVLCCITNYSVLSVSAVLCSGVLCGITSCCVSVSVY